MADQSTTPATKESRVPTNDSPVHTNNSPIPTSKPLIPAKRPPLRITPGANSRAATNSLLILAFGLAGALLLDRLFWPGNLWIAAFIAGCEAGLVGGLTDWFAVTALFRHPFGLRLPHTAILPNNRDRIADALVSMVENDLLHKESLRVKIKQLNTARRDRKSVV